jgi:hypothetical protein
MNHLLVMNSSDLSQDLVEEKNYHVCCWSPRYLLTEPWISLVSLLLRKPPPRCRGIPHSCQRSSLLLSSQRLDIREHRFTTNAHVVSGWLCKKHLHYLLVVVPGCPHHAPYCHFRSAVALHVLARRISTAASCLNLHAVGVSEACRYLLRSNGNR